MSYTERRVMNENIKPHEAVRQVHQFLSDFEVSGDATWPLRNVRDLVLDYFRALSLRYSKMSGNEKAPLCKLVVFEAARHRVGEIEGNEADLLKYRATIRICEAIEG